MKLALAAFVLSVIALGAAISQPLWNLYSTPTPTPAPEGEPIFILTYHQIFQFDTSFTILNNGTSDAHDVEVGLSFWGGNAMSMSQSIPEIRNKTYATFDMPFGHFQLTYGGQELGWYQGAILIKCREIPLGIRLYFDVE